MKFQDHNCHISCKFEALNSLDIGCEKISWKKDYCQGLKFYTFIASDGEVYPCCRVWEIRNIVMEISIKKILNQYGKGEKRLQIDQLLNNTPTSW